MNIFILDSNPEKCVKYHNDIHVNKQLIEATQLLCTAIWYKKFKDHKEYSKLIDVSCDSSIKNKYKEETGLYLPTHVNHSCSIWTRESVGNYIWLCDLAKELSKEYRIRRFKKHASESVVDWCIYNVDTLKFDKKEMTDFVLVMPDKYKIDGNAVQSYRNYYIEEKQGFYLKNGDFYRHKWTNTSKPDWWQNKFVQPYKIPTE